MSWGHLHRGAGAAEPEARQPGSFLPSLTLSGPRRPSGGLGSQLGLPPQTVTKRKSRSVGFTLRAKTASLLSESL